MISFQGRRRLVVAATMLLGGTATVGAQTLWASFYGAESGRITASGRRFDPMGLTVAHPSWRFGTRVEICFRLCAICTVTDRGPARWTGRGIDLSRGCARATGLERVGVGAVRARPLD